MPREGVWRMRTRPSLRRTSSMEDIGDGASGRVGPWALGNLSVSTECTSCLTIEELLDYQSAHSGEQIEPIKSIYIRGEEIFMGIDSCANLHSVPVRS